MAALTALLTACPMISTLAFGPVTTNPQPERLLKSCKLLSPRLTALRLSSCRLVTDRGLASVAARLPALTRLDLAGATGVSDAGLSRLSAMTRLRRLDLSRTAVSNTCLARLCALTQLQWLDLSGTGVASDGLAPLLRLPALQQLSVLRCDRLTDENLVQLLPAASGAAEEAVAAELARRAAIPGGAAALRWAGGLDGGGLVSLLSGRSTATAQEHARAHS